MTRDGQSETGPGREPVDLPPCGMFIGTGVYPMAGGYLLSTLLTHQAWTPETTSPEQMIRRVVDDNQGNMIQLWGYARGYAPAMLDEWFYDLDEIGVDVPEPDWRTCEHLRPEPGGPLDRHADRYGAGLVRFVKRAAERGLFTLCIYTDARDEWVAQLRDAGKHYLGYDFGERFTFSLDNPAVAAVPPEDVTLQLLADDLVRRVAEHVEARRAVGWGPIFATSSNFHVDYEILAGADVPLIEDFAFRHLNVASALSRGLSRQFRLPLWGSHMAHEHYSWLPLAAEHKFDLLAAAMKQKYLAGCKMLINESGNWFVEASLCEDSPKFNFPHVPPDPEIDWSGSNPAKFVPYQAEARRHFGETDYGSPTCREYRRVMSEFYDFVKANPAPAGLPESTLAVVKGNYDLANHTFSPNNAIGGVYELAAANPLWFEGAPERGWQTVKDVFYPLHDVLGAYPNHFLSGTPYGMVDIVTFAGDRLDVDFLSGQYKALLMAGWNTASEAQYAALTEYVRRGGTLFIAIPHLSMRTSRDYLTYTAADLVRGGDLSELCGVRVKGPGRRFYWATVAPGVDELESHFPRRFGILMTRLGDLDILDDSVEPMVVDDEFGEPLLLRRRCGKGTVYFLNSWEYPGALCRDEGPGARVGSKGLIAEIYRHIAERSRGTVWITDDGRNVGPESEYVAWSHFPETGRICLQNVDFDRPRRVFVHGSGKSDQIELEGGEFRILDPRTGAER